MKDVAIGLLTIILNTFGEYTCVEEKLALQYIHEALILLRKQPEPTKELYHAE